MNSVQESDEKYTIKETLCKTRRSDKWSRLSKRVFKTGILCFACVEKLRMKRKGKQNGLVKLEAVFSSFNSQEKQRTCFLRVSRIRRFRSVGNWKFSRLLTALSQLSQIVRSLYICQYFLFWKRTNFTPLNNKLSSTFSFAFQSLPDFLVSIKTSSKADSLDSLYRCTNYFTLLFRSLWFETLKSE
jgi:hypothetical protein